MQRDAAPLSLLRLGTGLAVFGSVAAPWFVLVQAQNPEFFDFFFIQEHFARFALSGHHRPGPWWYFVPVLFVISMPWTPVLPAVLARAWRAPATGRLHVDRFLICWVAVIFLFFSVSSSKLPAYVLPVLPALALLVARHWSALPPATQRMPAIALILIGVVLAVTTPIIDNFERFAVASKFIEGYELWLLIAAGVLAVTGTLALHLTAHDRKIPIVVLTLGSMFALQFAMLGMHVFDERYSSEELIERIAGEGKQFERDIAFYSVSTFEHSVPFYLGRTVTLVKYRGEMAPGIAAEPDKQIDTLEAFEQRWRNHDNAYAVMTTAQYEALRDEGLPMRLVDRDTRRVVVARR
jgi:4-amino-4-deoxy-L-arabinose transferase-like glycosyltransferase